MTAIGATAEEILRDVVKAELSRRGMGITEGCASLLDAMVGRGAIEVESAPQRMSEAEARYGVPPRRRTRRSATSICAC